MIVTLACAPARVNVPVEEPSSMRRSRCPSAFVTTMWTLLAALRAAEASCSTSAGDFFSRPLVVVRAAVVAPPQALATMVTVLYGTLMARRSWSSLRRWSAELGVGRAHERAIVFGGRRIRPGEGIRHARLGVRGRPGGALALPGTTAISVAFPQVPCGLRRQSVRRADRVESG